jgi:Tfp pilus assembly protein PilO
MKLDKFSIQFPMLIIGFLLISFFVAWPLVNQIESSQANIENKYADFQSMMEKSESLKKAAKNSSEMAEINSKVMALYPDSKDVSNFIIDLEKIAEEENITLNNLSISEPKTTPKKGDKSAGSTIQFDFSTEGSYSQMSSLVKKLEQFSRINTINTLNIASKGDDLINIKISGMIYYGN